MTPKKSTLAYSYTRFSTPEQAQGDSLRRQIEMRDRYIAQHGLKLDDSLHFHDAGKSAFRGSNAKGGALALFLRAVEDGDVPAGSVLLIETADRLSRMPMRKALRILESIIESDIDVVFLDEGKRYDRAALDGMDLLLFLLKAFRGHEESATKSRRLKAAWAGKREKAAAGKIQLMTRHVPAWLTADDGKPMLIPERAEIVKRVFSEFVAGRGQGSIATGLNADKVPCWGYFGRKAAPHWRRSYINKILRNPAAAGVFVPRVEVHDEKAGTTRAVEQDPIKGYYPAAIDMATWGRARALLKSTGRTAGPVKNMLAGLAKCPNCERAMERIMKGTGAKAGVPKLICSAAKHGVGAGLGCTATTVKLPEIEQVLIGRKFNPPHPDAELEEELRHAEGARENVQHAIQNLVDAIAERPSAALSQRLAKLEVELEECNRVVVDLHAKGAETDSRAIKRRAENLVAALSRAPVDVPAVNVAMRECFSKVVVDWKEGTLRMHWRHGGETVVRYIYVDTDGPTSPTESEQRNRRVGARKAA
jgi:DNA invertase Pin-like site-specific DNA recombinase